MNRSMLKTLASALVIASLGFVAQAQADCGGCGGGLLARLHAKHSCGGGLLAKLHAGRCGGVRLQTSHRTGLSKTAP